MSPGRAPERTTGAWPPRSPTAVTAMVSVPLADMSPPTTAAPTSEASAASPSASSSAQLAARSAGAQSATTSARSTARPSGVATTAASSPGPSRQFPPKSGRLSALDSRPSRDVTRAMSPNSPVVATVMAPSIPRRDHRIPPGLPVVTFLCGSFTAGRARAAEGSRVVVQAYIRSHTEVAKARDVPVEIRDIAGVVRVDAVTGPYDVVVLTEARSVDELGKMIVSKVQLVPGITRTLTLVALPIAVLAAVVVFWLLGGFRQPPGASGASAPPRPPSTAPVSVA